MVVIRITGGLGNQMFQYAAGCAASLRNQTELQLDVMFYDENTNKLAHEEDYLTSVFTNIKNLNLKKISRKALDDAEANGQGFIQSKLNAFRASLGIQPLYVKFTEKDLLTYQPAFPNQKAVFLYLAGDWQNEDYFNEYESIIRHNFIFPEILTNSMNSDILSHIQSSNSVSIHVRRGDYLSSSSHQALSYSYYTDAVSLIRKNIPAPEYFIFSDDIDWCRKNLGIDNAHYIDHNSGITSYIDMNLMSNCKHNIIANSSFSWWGAWLNKNPNKTVIVPNIWLEKMGIKSTNIVPKQWITL